MFVEGKKGLIFRYVLAGRFPGEGGVVAPGMSCKYIVRFAPDSLGDYEDFITVETQVEHLLVVPIVAGRPPPVLTCESHYNPPTFSQETVCKECCSGIKTGLALVFFNLGILLVLLKLEEHNKIYQLCVVVMLIGVLFLVNHC